MWKKLRFFDFIEIFDEPNTPWTLETCVFSKEFRASSKQKAAFWFIMSFWTFFLLRMIFMYTRYYRTANYAEDYYPQVFLFIRGLSFILIFFIVPFCILWFLKPKSNNDLYSLFYTATIKDMPYYITDLRPRDIIDDCIDTESGIDYWF